MIGSTLKKGVIFIILILVTQTIFSQQNQCDYFNVPKPSIIPKDFNPEILNLNGRFKFNVEIKRCDEIYFTTIDRTENIYFSKKHNGEWSKPTIASFSDANYNDADPFLTKDGNRIYFISKRPTHASDTKLDFNIWYAERTNDAWSPAKPLPEPINLDDFDEYFFSISDKGNAYFSSNRTGGEGSFDIYTTKLLDNHTFSTPKNAGSPLNTEKYEFDPYISPDERFIHFSINENGNSSLYVSFKDENNRWTTPQNLGKLINITRQDFAPSLSADGKFIFFSNNGRLKWVSSQLLNSFSKN